MKRFWKGKDQPWRGLRLLRAEPLERRQLLAVTPMGMAEIDFVPDDAATYGEIAPDSAASKADVVECDFKVELALADRSHATEGAGSLSPISEINIPETIAQPAFEKIPGLLGPPGSEFPPEWELPAGVDPGKLPGHGCPHGAPGEGDRFVDWLNGERDSDILHHPEKWDAATREKIHGALIRASDPCDQDVHGEGACYDVNEVPTDEEANYDPDAEDEDVGTDNGDDECPEDTMCFDEDEIHDNTDDEGDVPEENLYPGAQGASRSDPTSQSQTGPRRSVTEGTEDDGEGIGQRVKDEARPDPEEGGPDEATSPAMLGALDLAGFGFNHQPAPDDPDGPDDPRASDGVASCVAASGYASSPPDGGEGGGYVPIGPEFSGPIAKLSKLR